jgi:DNA-binding GntR family transcriptional regulator
LNVRGVVAGHGRAGAIPVGRRCWTASDPEVMVPAPRQSDFLERLLPASRNPTGKDVLAELRRVILQGNAAPGTPIPVDQVAVHFGVSPIPVREALKTLIGEGLVDHRSHIGYAVARLTKSEFQELYLVRGVLERAAMTAAIGLATEEDDAEVRRFDAELDECLRQGDLPGYNRESRLFHFAMLQPCRMQRVLHMIEAAWNVTEPCQPMAHVGDDDRRRLHDDHHEMRDAFIARDRARLIALADTHQHRLDEVIATLPDDSGLFAAEAVPTPAAGQ